MATPDLKPHRQEIEQQFTDLFYGKYMAEQWGIEVGYNSIPSYYATMRIELLEWQDDMDCDNSLCVDSRSTGVTVVTRCAGSADLNIDYPCCNDNARFEPLNG